MTTLVRVLQLQTTLLVLGLAALFAAAAWSGLAEARRAATVAVVTRTLSRGLAGSEDAPETPEEAEQLARLPAAVQTDLVGHLMASLGGAQRERLQGLALRVGLPAEARSRCRSRRWWRRLQGVRVLTMVGGGVEVVPVLLGDPHPEVRAAAARWAADHPDRGLVRRLVAVLDDGSPLCRFTAQDSLLRLGAAVAEPLVAYLEGAPGAGEEAALQVAAARPDPRFLPSALARCAHPRAPVRALAARLLGAVGGPDVPAPLRLLLADPDHRVRAAAAVALGACGCWPAAPALAGLLDDPAEPVRRGAAAALLSLGGPGIVYLRRGARGGGPGADNARHLLERAEPARPAAP